MRNRPIVLTTLATLSLLLAACGGGGSDNSSSTPSTVSDNTVCGKTTATGDLLAEVCDRGTITVSTDPKYPPQSSYDAKAGEYVGFDIDVATEIANRLGVDIAWETPSWAVLTAGGWNDRWQMSVGSMTPTNDRQKVLIFSQPYYYTPAVVLVNEANTDITDLATDLDGKKIGVCSGCTYEQFLDKTLAIKGFQFDFIIDDADIHGYDTDTTALQDLALGDGTRLDAVITSLTTAQGYIDAGNPVKIVGDPVFYEPLSVAIDKNSPKDPATLAAAVDTIVKQMHADGTLSQLSKKWYNGTDLTKVQ
jgi:polar amino acid transport system substrate-binding protein